MILNNYKQFIKEVLQKIDTLGIDVSTLHMDHIGYQASSDENYDTLKKLFEKFGTIVSEELVGNRRVGIYKLKSPLLYQPYIISAIELIAPKEGQRCISGLEHVEFVLNESFSSFMKRYPDIPWDTSAMNRVDFPMIKVQLDTYLQAKFHHKSVLEMMSANNKSI
ncbi:MAG: VOC family protein [Candidatus Roizmanbacteria bacterium]|nr:VOC family protein [Candidatus Roizmanbacteria bacterium]